MRTVRRTPFNDAVAVTAATVFALEEAREVLQFSLIPGNGCVDLKAATVDGMKTANLQFRDGDPACTADSSSRMKVVREYERVAWVVHREQLAVFFCHFESALDVHARRLIRGRLNLTA